MLRLKEVVGSVCFVQSRVSLVKESRDAVLCFDRHEIVTSDPLSLMDMATMISFY